MVKIETQIKQYVDKAIKSKQAYYENLQVAYEIFIAHYNKELNHNSQPLFMILKACGKDITLMKDYIIKSTNITKLSISDKGGLKLTFNGEFTFNDSFIDSHKWYDSLVKADKKAVKLLDNDSFIRLVKGLIKRVEKSDKMTHKEVKTAMLNKLLTA